MKLFPAVDILDNRAVRLLYGDREKVTDYGDPIELANRWQDEGAECLHIVDLNGAFDDSRVNEKTLIILTKSIKIPIQLGGGIKSLDKIKYCFETIGASKVIVGTACVSNPKILESACNLYPQRIISGIDAKDGRVAIKGWVESVDITPLELALRMKENGVDTVIFTDISRDGALSGVNVESTAQLQKASKLNIVASGGVSNIKDIKKLIDAKIYGAILGRALYTGDLKFCDAISLSMVAK